MEIFQAIPTGNNALLRAHITPVAKPKASLFVIPLKPSFA
jgi:hypothetical protein